MKIKNQKKINIKNNIKNVLRKLKIIIKIND